MALNFPPNPQVGNITITEGKTWMWDGSRWNRQSLSANNLIITGALTANSSNGQYGQLLTSNGTSVFWANTRLDRLEDVVATNLDSSPPANGQILTYISNSNKYFVVPLNVADTTLSNTSIDGGTF